MDWPTQRVISLTALLLVGPGAALGQISAPRLGFVLNEDTGEVRPILGLPGAPVLGAALDLGGPIKQVAHSPRQDYVLAVTVDGRVLLRTSSRMPAPLPVRQGIDHVGLSPTGRYAVVLDRDSAHWVVVNGLPDTPSVGRPVLLPLALGSPEHVAVSDDGFVLASFSLSDAVFLIDNGTAESVATFDHVSAMAFLPRSRDVLVADDARAAVYLVRDVAGGGQHTTLLAGRSAGLARPIGVASSADGERFFIADSESQVVLVFDGAGRSLRILCPCTPTGMTLVRTDAVFLMTRQGRGSLAWLFDGRPDRLRAVSIQTPPP